MQFAHAFAWVHHLDGDQRLARETEDEETPSSKSCYCCVGDAIIVFDMSYTLLWTTRIKNAPKLARRGKALFPFWDGPVTAPKVAVYLFLCF